MIYLLEDKDAYGKDKYLYFYAQWMPHKSRMINLIEKCEKQFNITFIAVDCDSFKNVYKYYEIENLPTILINKKKIVGVPLWSSLKKFVGDILNNYGEDNEGKKSR